MKFKRFEKARIKTVTLLVCAKCNGELNVCEECTVKFKLGDGDVFHGQRVLSFNTITSDELAHVCLDCYLKIKARTENETFI